MLNLFIYKYIQSKKSSGGLSSERSEVDGVRRFMKTEIKKPPT